MKQRYSPLWSLIILAGLLALPACKVIHVNTSTATRYFPVGSSAETGWRVDWTFQPHPQDPGEQIWVITGVDFMRGYKTVNGQQEEDWIHVLDELAPAAMFVPYVENSSRYRDFYGYYTGLAQLDKTAVSNKAYKPTYIHEDMIVRETTDDFVRWIENGPGGYGAVARLKRGQAMVLWGMFSAYNYVYPVVFKFRDDGVIQVRIAASGQNLSDQVSIARAHLHMGAWRAEFNLCADGNATCAPEDVIIEKVSRRDTGGQEQIVFEPFNGDVEGGDDWDATEFTALLASNPGQPNGRPVTCEQGETPPCTSSTPIGYALVPIRYGVARFKNPNLGNSNAEDFLDHDFWVTRKPVPPALAEIFYTEIQDYANGESLTGYQKVVWHKSAFNHIPRYEDMGFGANDAFDADEGVALATYTGFDLVPRNVMFKTPTYTP